MNKRRIRLTQRSSLAAVVALVAALLAGVLGGSASAAYPGANGKIAFQSSGAGTNLDIWSMKSDGSGQTNLTNDSAADSEPIWSPNGSTIAFVKASEGHTNIWVMNADGNGQTNLTPGPAGTAPPGFHCRPGPNGQYGITPSWSPSGSEIAYSVSGDIFVMQANGDGKSNITCSNNGQFFEAEPAWSPDGSTIAYRYHSDDARLPRHLGDEQRRHEPQAADLDAGVVRESFPDWSPDGTEIVYMKSQPAGSIWKMNADGSGQTMLIGGPGGGCGRDPVWSPDGTKIAFSSNCFDAHNGYDLFVMSPDGTSVLRVPSPEPPASDFFPSWQPAASALPTVKIGNATVVEGDAGTVAATFVLRLSEPSAQTVTVDYETGNGTAKAPGDYQAAGGTVAFAPGETSKTVTVDVVGETLYEKTEKFSVLLTGSTNATIADNKGVGTIKDDDPQPSLVINDVLQNERNAGTANWAFVVTLSTVSGAVTKVDYATGDGTALAGSDYVAKSGTLSIPAGQTTKAIVISVIGDTVVEPDETFVVTLSNPIGATLSDDQGVGTIVNDD